MKALKLFSIKSTYDGFLEEQFVLSMDLFELQGNPSLSGMEKYRLSWIIFSVENPSKRILMDNHPPIGLHIHYDSGPQIPVPAVNIDEAMSFFIQEIEQKFGIKVSI